MGKSLLIAVVLLSSLIGGITGTLATYLYFREAIPYKSANHPQVMAFTNFSNDTLLAKKVNTNFKVAAAMAVPAVVHIRISLGPGDFSLNPLDHMFNIPARSSGSGVIISENGLIVTNYHVVEDARSIEVVLNNNQRFYAKIIGADPTTDLALIRIKASDLPYLDFGNSDVVIPGDWVLAVGNPFDLNSTVTAGIVSAKARNIGILADRNNLQVESFLQTDAAVNPGNSGGALVSLEGQLIGINSAIATSTGNYSGYSFAIPSNLVKKVVGDLNEFGQVQRGLLGIQIQDVTAELAEEEGINASQGVFITAVKKGSAAEESGIAVKDVIVAVNGDPVNNTSELQERIARFRPGDTVILNFFRSKKMEDVKVILKSFDGSEKLTYRKIIYHLGGGTFAEPDGKDISKLGIDGGVLLKIIENGKWKDAGIKPDFVICFIDKVPVEGVSDLNRILEHKKGGILVEGKYLDGKKGVYGVNW